MTMAGPALAMAAELLTNSPAPIMPPMEIMVMWRGCSDRLSSGGLLSLGSLMAPLLGDSLSFQGSKS